MSAAGEVRCCRIGSCRLSEDTPQAGLHKHRHRGPSLGSLFSESLHDGVGDVQRYLHKKTIGNQMGMSEENQRISLRGYYASVSLHGLPA